jgi:hypothetical protein
MLHLDFRVSGAQQMEEAVRHATACGAQKARVQYDERWTVMIDPAGIPSVSFLPDAGRVQARLKMIRICPSAAFFAPYCVRFLCHTSMIA